MFGLSIGAVISGIIAFFNGPSLKTISEAVATTARAKADTTARLAEAAQKTNAEAVRADAVQLKELDYHLEGLRMMQAIIIAEQTFPVLRSVRPTFAYMFALHIGGVILSSYGWIGTMHALPNPLDWLELGVVGS